MRISDWSSDVCSSDLLDFFLPNLKEPAMRDKQELFYAAQLDLAERYGLTLLLHVRRSQDILLKHLRPRRSSSGESTIMVPRSAERRVGTDCVSTCGFR